MPCLNCGLSEHHLTTAYLPISLIKHVILDHQSRYYGGHLPESEKHTTPSIMPQWKVIWGLVRRQQQHQAKKCKWSEVQSSLLIVTRHRHILKLSNFAVNCQTGNDLVVVVDWAWLPILDHKWHLNLVRHVFVTAWGSFLLSERATGSHLFTGNNCALCPYFSYSTLALFWGTSL